jgi:hypothetical protein
MAQGFGGGAMYIPLVKKIIYKNDLLIERSLPEKGSLVVKVGDKVEPFSKLGVAKTSYEKLIIGPDLNVVKHKKDGSYFYTGEKLGTYNFTRVIAPYHGYLKQENDQYVFIQEPRDYWLLSGVWGTVENIYKDNSVLLRTQSVDINFVVGTSQSISGELVVFPNPDEELVEQYLNNLSKNISGKVVYVGEFLSESTFKVARSQGVLGIIAGGADKLTLNLAKESSTFVALITGFGKVSVPSQIFGILQSVTNRYVMIDGEERVLRIPVPEKFSDDVIQTQAASSLKFVKKGVEVLTLQKPYFGKIGKVDRVTESSILVKFPEKEEPVEIFIPNVLAV